jgi:hypothetical protein
MNWFLCLAGTVSGLVLGVETGAGVNPHILWFGPLGCTVLGGIAGAVSGAAALCRR